MGTLASMCWTGGNLKSLGFRHFCVQLSLIIHGGLIPGSHGYQNPRMLMPTKAFSSLLSSLPVYYSCLPRSSATSTQGRGDCLLSYLARQVIRKSFLKHLPEWQPCFSMSQPMLLVSNILSEIPRTTNWSSHSSV